MEKAENPKKSTCNLKGLKPAIPYCCYTQPLAFRLETFNN